MRTVVYVLTQVFINHKKSVTINLYIQFSRNVSSV